MKKKYFLLISMTIAFNACTLDETPIDALPEGNAYENSELVYLNTVMGLYPEIRNLARDVYWDMCQLSTDEAIIPTRGGNWDDNGKFRAMYEHTWVPSIDMFRDFWNDAYTAIGKCNQSIDTLKEIKENNPEADVDNSIAEIRAIRALFYFQLLDLFGRVPLSTSSQIVISEVKQPARSELFTFVKEELQEALPLLASAPSSGGNSTYYGRMTKGVAYFLLAKLALNAEVYTDDNWEVTGANPNGSTEFTINNTNVGAWQAVVAYCDSIDAEGFYSLENDFRRNFRVQNEGSSENIFTIPLDPSTHRYNTTLLNLRTLHYGHGAAYGMGTWNGTCATNELMEAFEINTENQDPRLDLSFYTGIVYGPDGNPIIVNDSEEVEGQKDPVPVTYTLEYFPLEVKLWLTKSIHDLQVGARWRKYEIDTQFQDAGGVVHNDYVLFRYADVLLMRAEALLRAGGNAGQAKDLVNQVRNRVGAKELENITLDDILKERMLELSWEGTRRTDLIRFGEFSKPITDRSESAPFRIVYPIPADVMSSNRNLTQNPKY